MKTMKLVRYYEAGGPEVLQIEEVPIPQPATGQVLVKVEAIDTGLVDTQIRRPDSPWGTPAFPVAPGDYVYGKVVEVGPDTPGVQVGEPLLGFAPSGAYAEYALVPLANRFNPLPDVALSPAELVSLPVSGETAYHILTTAAQLQSGERVLIHGAAGGIGHLGVQLAKALGAGQIIATASSTAKLNFVKSLGADVVTNYTEANWPEQVRTATDGKGVDVVLDVVGGQVLVESLAVLAPFGRLITYGAASGNIPTLPAASLFDLLMGSKRLEGFSSFTLMQLRPELITQLRQEFIQYVEQGKVRPHILQTFSLDQVADAHRLLESRAAYGKIILCP